MKTIRLTYLLTPWSRVLLEKLTGSAASQEIPRIFGTRRFLTYPQAPATCPYREPTPFSHHNPLPLPEDPSLLTYLLTYLLHGAESFLRS